MAFVPSTKSRLLLGDFHLATYTTNISLTSESDMLDTTVLTDTSKQFIVGQNTSTLAASGHHDLAEFTDLTSFKSAAVTPFTYAPSGWAVGSEAVLVNVLESDFETSAPISGTVDWSLSAQTSGLTDIGYSLADLAAVTSDTNGTSHDGTAATTGGGVGHLHVPAFSGFSGVVVTIQDSADNSVWATIGTFTTVAGLTSERLEIAGTIRRYVRAAFDVTGTGSVTAQVSYARR